MLYAGLIHPRQIAVASSLVRWKVQPGGNCKEACCNPCPQKQSLLSSARLIRTIEKTSTPMLPSPSIFMPSSQPKNRMARLAILALSGQLVIASVRRSRLSIPCFHASILSFLIRPATISRPSKDTFLLLDTGIPHPDSTVVVSSIDIQVFFSSFSFIYQRQNFFLQRQGGS